MFAKLYNTIDHGQILAVVQQADDPAYEAEIRLTFEGFGGDVLMSVVTQFRDDDTGEAWDKAGAKFQDMTMQRAIDWVAGIKSDIGDIGAIGDTE